MSEKKSAAKVLRKPVARAAKKLSRPSNVKRHNGAGSLAKKSDKKSKNSVKIKPVSVRAVTPKTRSTRPVISKNSVNGHALMQKEGNGILPSSTENETQNESLKAAARKSRKNARKVKIRAPLPPPVEVSNHPKTRVKQIMVSQPQPFDGDKNPYLLLAKKHHLNVTFRQFIKVEGLSAVEFRLQRVDILEHGAVILTSKMAVDHFFRICQEMRITVPETIKYFCINEQTAYYLQKYIQYRKRKIFFGHGTLLDLVDVIKKNRTEKFLLPAADVQKEQIADIMEELNITFTRATFYKTVPADLRDIKTLDGYDVLVFFTPVGIRSLKQNFPGFRQGNTRIAAFGRTTALTVKTLGYRLDIFSPSPQNPSMSSALDSYIKESNKR
jgi:uroporphyrinogen-III synthase